MQETQGISSATVIIIIAMVAIILVGILAMVLAFFKKVEQGQVLLINNLSGEPMVSFSGGLVLPVVHKAEVMDITMKTVRIECQGRNGLRFADDETLDVAMRFYVRVNNEPDDILRVARAVGAQRASDLATLEDLFAARLLEAMKTAARAISSTEFEDKLDDFRDHVIMSVGADLNGYVLDDALVDFTHQAKTTVSHGRA